MENNLESLPLPRRLEELFQEIVSSLGQEDRAAWDEHKKNAQLKVCARYTSKLLRQGEDPLRLIPETVSKLCLIPLLKKCAAMDAADLDLFCDWKTTQSPVPLDIETEQAVATLRGQAVTVTDAEFDATSSPSSSRLFPARPCSHGWPISKKTRATGERASAMPGEPSSRSRPGTTTAKPWE